MMPELPSPRQPRTRYPYGQIVLGSAPGALDAVYCFIRHEQPDVILGIMFIFGGSILYIAISSILKRPSFLSFGVVLSGLVMLAVSFIIT
ncbi:MAG: hypothetical protein PHI63_04065 [Patescibacteria group bacterium]|nr:hypothetical protein [Patescibacteria group bacterium]